MKKEKENIKTIQTIKTLFEMINNTFSTSPEPVIIAVGGPGGSGKTTFANMICEELSDCDVVGADAYKIPKKDRPVGLEGPHPMVNNIKLLKRHMKSIKEGKKYNKLIKKWDGSERGSIKTVPKKYNIVEGEISTYNDFKEFVDFSIFVDATKETQLKIRLTRDVIEGGLTEKEAKTRFVKSNIEQFGKYGYPTKKHSDIHIMFNNDYSFTLENNILR